MTVTLEERKEKIVNYIQNNREHVRRSSAGSKDPELQ